MNRQQSYSNNEPKFKIEIESRNMFNGMSSEEQDTRNADDMFFENSNNKEKNNVNRDTLNPINFYNSYSDDGRDTLIIPKVSAENVKDSIFSNVWNNAELVISRRNSK